MISPLAPRRITSQSGCHLVELAGQPSPRSLPSLELDLRGRSGPVVRVVAGESCLVLDDPGGKACGFGALTVGTMSEALDLGRFLRLEREVGVDLPAAEV